MSNRPARQRPSGQSAILLSPQVERLHTPVDEAPPAVAPAQPVAANETPTAVPTTIETGTVDTAPPAPASALSAATQQPEIDPTATKPVTLQILTRLKLRMETAINATGRAPDGHTSQAKFVNAAIERELERLEQQYNGGDQFPPNMGPFRVGRPFGS